MSSGHIPTSGCQLTALASGSATQMSYDREYSNRRFAFRSIEAISRALTLTTRSYMEITYSAGSASLGLFWMPANTMER